MIESRGLPIGSCMATPAIGLDVQSGLKLAVVDVGMARATDARGPAEGD